MFYFEDDLVVVDLDGGIFVPQLTELHPANENVGFKARNAFALCEKLLIPRKLAASLATKLEEAVAVGEGPRADFLLQRVGFCFLSEKELLMNWDVNLSGLNRKARADSFLILINTRNQLSEFLLYRKEAFRLCCHGLQL